MWPIKKLTPPMLVIPHLLILMSVSSLSSSWDWEMFTGIAHSRSRIWGWMHTRQLRSRTKMKYWQAKAGQNSKMFSREIILSLVLNSMKWSRYTALNSCYFTIPDIILKMELGLSVPFPLSNCNCTEDMNMLLVCNEIWDLR